MPIGPQLPPTSEKRKRDDVHTDSGDDVDESVAANLSDDDDAKVKRTRVLGPTLPPAPLDERPSVPVNEDDSSENSSDDDFGPALPSAANSGANKVTSDRAPSKEAPLSAEAVPAPRKRDEWMTLAPSNGDWSSRIDPTKLKSRKFNTGKSASTATAKTGQDVWHETPEQKQARIHREMMGIKDEALASKSSNENGPSQKDIETAKRIKEYNAQRGPSLFDAHQKTQKEEDDNPSARAFDREKDIGGGLQLNSTQRRDLLKKASDFTSRFSGAKYS